MLCPVDIKIKTSSHRERLVVREVWEQSRRRRRGDLPSQRFRFQRRMICSKREREMQRRQTQPCRSISQLQTERNGGNGRGGDEEDIRKKKNSDILWHFISFYSLSVSLPLARSRSLLLLHYRSHHWNSGDSTWRFLSARHRQVGRFSLSHGGTWCTGMR